MNIQDRIKYLFDISNDKKPSQLSKILNTKQSTIDGWIKQGKCPSAAVIPTIAQYFGVTTDYLLTGKEPQNQSDTDLTDDEIELLSTYRKLPLKGKTMTRAYAYNYLEQAELRTLPIAARDGGILSHSLTKEEIQQAEENTPELPPRKQPPKFDL